MKINHRHPSLILWIESVGFLYLIALSWLDEYHSTWRESAVESAAVIVVWAVVFYFTRRLILHLYYLEGFMRVCSWCKNIEHNGSWMPLEKYFEAGFKSPTTHGMCPECAEKMRLQFPPN
jgi:hypothetical protein